MIGLTMHVRTKPEKSDLFAHLTAKLQRDVRANEPGTLIFQVMRAQDDPTLFVFIEVFADAAAHAAHPEMPYHKAMSADGWACVDGEPDIRMFDPLTDNNISGEAA